MPGVTSPQYHHDDIWLGFGSPPPYLLRDIHSTQPALPTEAPARSLSNSSLGAQMPRDRDMKQHLPLPSGGSLQMPRSRDVKQHGPLPGKGRSFQVPQSRELELHAVHARRSHAGRTRSDPNYRVESSPRPRGILVQSPPVNAVSAGKRTITVKITRADDGSVGLRFARQGNASNGPFEVRSVVRHSAAEKSGVVRPGDVFCDVDGHDVSELTSEEVACLFRGAPRSDLQLGLLVPEMISPFLAPQPEAAVENPRPLQAEPTRLRGADYSGLCEPLELPEFRNTPRGQHLSHVVDAATTANRMLELSAACMSAAHGVRSPSPAVVPLSPKQQPKQMEHQQILANRVQAPEGNQVQNPLHSQQLRQIEAHQQLIANSGQKPQVQKSLPPMPPRFVPPSTTALHPHPPASPKYSSPQSMPMPSGPKAQDASWNAEKVSPESPLQRSIPGKGPEGTEMSQAEDAVESAEKIVPAQRTKLDLYHEAAGLQKKLELFYQLFAPSRAFRVKVIVADFVEHNGGSHNIAILEEQLRKAYGKDFSDVERYLQSSKEKEAKLRTKPGAAGTGGADDAAVAGGGFPAPPALPKRNKEDILGILAVGLVNTCRSASPNPNPKPSPRPSPNLNSKPSPQQVSISRPAQDHTSSSKDTGRVETMPGDVFSLMFGGFVNSMMRATAQQIQEQASPRPCRNVAKGSKKIESAPTPKKTQNQVRTADLGKGPGQYSHGQVTGEVRSCAQGVAPSPKGQIGPLFHEQVAITAPKNGTANQTKTVGPLSRTRSRPREWLERPFLASPGASEELM